MKRLAEMYEVLPERIAGLRPQTKMQRFLDATDTTSISVFSEERDSGSMTLTVALFLERGKIMPACGLPAR